MPSKSPFEFFIPRGNFALSIASSVVTTPFKFKPSVFSLIGLSEMLFFNDTIFVLITTGAFVVVVVPAKDAM